MRNKRHKDGIQRTNSWGTTPQQVQVQCCFTSIETIKTIRDDHVDFHTASELWVTKVQAQYCFTSVETPRGLLGTGIPGRPRRLSHSSWALSGKGSSSVLLYVHRDSKGTIRDGDPRTATSTFTQLLSSDPQQDKPSSYDSPSPSPSSDRSWASEKTWCLTSTETIMFVRDREKGGWRWWWWWWWWWSDA